MEPFSELQAQLPTVWELSRPGSTDPHVLVVMPAFSLGQSILDHYATRLGPMEHRYLLATLMLPRIPGMEMVFLTCERPTAEVLDYYRRLGQPGGGDAHRRLHVVTVEDRSPRPVSAKLLDRPDLVAHVRDLIGGRPAMLEPWNVTSTEVAVALELGIPVNGTDPALWPLAFKSPGRRLFRALGVPTPVGCEDVCDIEGVADAVAAIRRTRPHLAGVVVKHDNSGSGDGNLVVAVRDAERHRVRRNAVVTGLHETMPQWYVHDLESGAVVEELVRGRTVRSPSAQLEILPGGGARLLSTHEQVLGGDNGQVYSGCRFPADPAYSAHLAEYSLRVAEWLSNAGAFGRLGVDYMAVRRGGDWQVLALEVNLRKGGTTHPFTALRHLAPGAYDAARGSYVLGDGSTRSYRSTDALLDYRWRDLRPDQVIEAVAAAGLEFDPLTRTGVILHMLSCLKVDGRVGVTAIARSPEEADEAYAATARTVAALA